MMTPLDDEPKTTVDDTMMPLDVDIMTLLDDGIVHHQIIT